MSMADGEPTLVDAFRKTPLALAPKVRCCKDLIE